MIDRLNELNARKSPTSSPTLSRAEEGAAGTPKPMHLQENDAFFSRLDKVKFTLGEVESAVRRIEHQHRQILNTVNVDVAHDILKKIGKETDATNTMIAEIRTSIKDLPNGVDGKHARLAHTQQGVLGRQLLKILKDWEQMQCTYKAKYRAQLERQYLIIKPDAGRDELDQLAQQSDMLSPRATQLMFSIGEDAEEKLRSMRERQSEIHQLERNIQDINRMFLDVSIMVNQQGEQVDRLDVNIAATEQYADLASDQMKKSVIQKKTNLRRKWIVIIVVILLLLGTGLVIYISYVMDQKSAPQTIVIHAPPPQQPNPSTPDKNKPSKPPAPRLPSAIDEAVSAELESQ